jgi:ATP-dependent Clp protease ATP-binding subunit ClpC
MEEGRLTDSFGRHVDFKNIILIMTSNIGADLIKNQSGFGFGKRTEDASYEKMKEMLDKEIERHFRPEFLNRVDDVIIFHSLDMEHLKRIVEIQLTRLLKLLEEKQIQLTLTDAAKSSLAVEGYDPVFGARPLKRVIQRSLQNPLAMKILDGSVKEGQSVTVDVKDGEIIFR